MSRTAQSSASSRRNGTIRVSRNTEVLAATTMAGGSGAAPCLLLHLPVLLPLRHGQDRLLAKLLPRPGVALQVLLLVAGVVLAAGQGAPLLGGASAAAAALLQEEGRGGGGQLHGLHEGGGRRVVRPLRLQLQEHLAPDGVLVVLAVRLLVVPRVLRVGEEVPPLRQGLLDVGEPGEDAVAALAAGELRGRLPAEAAVLLLHGLEDGLDEGPAALEDLGVLRGLELVLLRDLPRAPDLLQQVREHGGPPLVVVLLEAPLRVDLALELAVVLLEGLDLAVQGVHVGEEAEVPLLEADEYLHDLLDVRNPGRGLDRGEGLLEDLDVLLVLLDMPPLDGVEERQLQYAAVHRLLREGLLLVGDHVGTLPLVLHFRRVLRGPGELLLLLLHVALLAQLLLQAVLVVVDGVVEGPALALEHLAQRLSPLVRLFPHGLLIVDVGHQLVHDRLPLLDAPLQLLEDVVQYQPLFAELVDAFSQLGVLGRLLVQVGDGLLELPLEQLHLGHLVLHGVVAGVPALAVLLTLLAVLPLLVVLRLGDHQVLV
mmetsp:Transcript_1372/g.4003  ORF Transcript_1372/g.4003 Transcript_1372/m.4003 type:complete len:540 (-) Transcript_1372:195-1814(-)